MTYYPQRPIGRKPEKRRRVTGLRGCILVLGAILIASILLILVWGSSLPSADDSSYMQAMQTEQAQTIRALEHAEQVMGSNQNVTTCKSGQRAMTALLNSPEQYDALRQRRIRELAAWLNVCH